MIGRRIGVFDVQSLLGVGGMGEVYRAHDTRLGRDVAIKILADVWTSDPEQRARFDREARVLASLNHPYIGAIYGVEDVPDAANRRLVALVLELVEGDTLAVRLARAKNGLPIADALDAARQIAEALDAAHERGIVHRDLKPANVKLTPDGRVKVLDFGLAKTLVTVPDQSDAATISPASFGGGLIGTPAYMSPEQARGLTIDKRADIWAFGCVLFEMLTGRLAFPAATVPDTLVAILQSEPDWSTLPSALSPSVRRLLQRCLAKDPRRRLRDIGDAREDLVSPGGVDAAPRERLAAGVARVQFQRLTDFVGLNESPAQSPDGRLIAYVRPTGGRRQIWLQLAAGGVPLQLTHDDADHVEPRWAPDSSALIYHTPPTSEDDEGTLWEISALGGAPRPLLSSVGAGDISHAGDRIAVFQSGPDGAKLVTAARDGSDERVVKAGLEGLTFSSPRWSPDDRTLAYSASFLTHFDERLLVIAAGGGDPETLLRTRTLRGLAWLPDGSGLVYSSSAGSTIPYPPALNLRAVARDGTDDRALTYGDISYVQPDVHRSGRLVVCRARRDSDIWRIPMGGSTSENMRRAERITHQSGQVQTPAVSPDGRDIVFLSDHGGHANLWVCRADGSQMRQLTFERDQAVGVGVPQWSPAGRHISFVMSRGMIELWLIGPDGRGLRQLVNGGFSAAWSPDGESLYYVPASLALANWRIEKIAVRTGAVSLVRDDGRIAPQGLRGTTLYFASVSATGQDWELRRASPEQAESTIVARVPFSRVPLSPLLVHVAPSPDGRWLAVPLVDGATTNVWLVDNHSGAMVPATDFADRPTMIGRQVAWSPDGRAIYAAVAELQSDVILLDGLL